MNRRLLISAVIGLAIAAPAPAGAATSNWRLTQPAAPPPPAGVPAAPYPVPLGAVGDIQFWSPSRGILATEGTAPSDDFTRQTGVVPESLYRWDGKTWKPFSSVCSGGAAGVRIAWAGPREFWTIADQRGDARTLTNRPTPRTLCHFRDGAIVGSYATAASAANAYLNMNAAACNGPDDCWFGGPELAAPKAGAFHLHWDGTELKEIDGPQGRPVLDIAAYGDGFFEGTTISGSGAARLTTPEKFPLVLHSIVGRSVDAAGIGSDPFVSPSAPSSNDNEIDALASAGSTLWIGGGQATTGPRGNRQPKDSRLPLLAVKLGKDTPVKDLALSSTSFQPGERVIDIAPEPGTNTAWLAIQSPSAQAGAVIAHVDDTGKVLERLTLPLADDPDPNTKGSQTGAASKIACPAAGECWLATTKGWLYHLAGGAPIEQDDDPYMATTSTSRPDDGTSIKDISDASIADDSGADLTPVLSLPQTPTDDGLITDVDEKPAPEAKNIKAKALSSKTLELSFRLTAKAKVTVKLKYRGQVVASTKQTLGKGPHKLRFSVSTKRWPTKISFKVAAP